MDDLEIKLENDINYHIGLIKISLLEIKKLCKDKQQAYLYKDVIIILTNNILFLFLAFKQLGFVSFLLERYLFYH